MSKTQQGFSTRELKKIFSIVFVAYMVLAVAFYFLAGEQLRFRDSRGNIEMPVANAATVELTAGSVVERGCLEIKFFSSNDLSAYRTVRSDRPIFFDNSIIPEKQCS